MNYMNKIINLLGVALMPVIALAGGPEEVLPSAVSPEEAVRNAFDLGGLNVGLPHIDDSQGQQEREEEVDSSLRNHPREALRNHPREALDNWPKGRSPKTICKPQTPPVPRKARKK